MPLTEPPDPALLAAEWRIGAGSAELERARASLDAVLADALVDARAVYACELVLEEWLTNVWRHGYRQQPNDFGVVLRLRLDRQAVTLDFLDAGPAFDPCAMPQPVRPAGLAHAEPGGLGLTMIRRAASHWEHERRGHVNRLLVRIPRQAPRGGAPQPTGHREQ
jgi:serine/threonine-protein kinase RsbW